jgi:predicted acyltransferase
MKRSLALDVFRGLTVALMILVNNPGTWSYMYGPFEHAPWHGLTPTDLVFPFFLFAVGNAQALVFPAMWNNHPRKYFLKKLFKRSLIIFLIGLFLNWFPFIMWIGDDLKLKTWIWTNAEGVEVGIRTMGVLQRIGIAYGISGLLAYFFPRKALTVSLALLVIYWFMCVLLGSGDIYSIQGWFGSDFDKALLGSVHLYQGEGMPFDPEGLVSTFPAVAQVLLGFWVGRLLVQYNPRKIFKSLGKRGLILTILGFAWHFIHPINKKIWTGSYVLTTTGIAILILVLLVKFLDEKKYRSKVTYFFEAFGKNPLFIFVLSGLIPRAMALIRIPFQDRIITPLQWFYENVCTLIPGPPENGSLFYSLLFVFFYGLLAIWLDKKKTYIKV